MRDRDSLLLEQVYIYCENTRQAKQLVQAGKIDQEDLDYLIKADPTKTKKYVGWMAKQWANSVNEDPYDIGYLKSTIEEFDVFLQRGKTSKKDIYQYKTFKDLWQEVDRLNQSGGGKSNKELESDYEVIRDDDTLLICVPHTHEASRKLGLSKFAFRECGEGLDSAWCTTYKAPDHFNDYYYDSEMTFYYIKVRSEQLQQELEATGFGPEHSVVAVAVSNRSDMEAYDGNDEMLSDDELQQYLDIIGVS